MNIFAIGDLHLSGGDDKPMDIFGAQWEHHFDRISASWRQMVKEDDLVLIPGDISWAMAFSDALPDIRAIGELPGIKVLLRGNHDYWWPGINALRDALPIGMYALQNDALRFGDYTICGSRGWTLPNAQTTKEDKKIIDREMIRLKMSLDAGKRLGGRMIVMTHFPPCGEEGKPTEVTQLFSSNGVERAVYAHLHGYAGKNAFSGEIDGVPYHCVSCDSLDFTLYPVAVNEEKVENED